MTTACGMAANGLPRAEAKAGKAVAPDGIPAPVIKAARMMVRENEPAYIAGNLSGTAE